MMSLYSVCRRVARALSWRGVGIVALGAVLTFAVICQRVNSGAGSAVAAGGVQPTGAGMQPGDPIATSAAEMTAEGQLDYAHRPAAVQQVMDRMYGNDGRYGALSGIFVDRAPGDPVSSLYVGIRQPDFVRAFVYTNDAASGDPVEVVNGRGAQLDLYSPGHHAMTSMGRVVAQRLPPLSSLSIAVVQSAQSGTSLFSSRLSGPVSLLADMFIHPAALITSTFFTNKFVVVQGTTTYLGRAAWILHGSQVSGASAPAGLGDSWQMVVDTQSGVVLRIQYLKDGSVLGWAGFSALQVTGPDRTAVAPLGGSIDRYQQALETWSLPQGAAVLDVAKYNQLTTR